MRVRRTGDIGSGSARRVQSRVTDRDATAARWHRNGHEHLVPPTVCDCQPVFRTYPRLIHACYTTRRDHDRQRRRTSCDQPPDLGVGGQHERETWEKGPELEAPAAHPSSGDPRQGGDVSPGEVGVGLGCVGGRRPWVRSSRALRGPPMGRPMGAARSGCRRRSRRCFDTWHTRAHEPTESTEPPTT